MQQLFAISQPGGFYIKGSAYVAVSVRMFLVTQHDDRWRILFMFLFLFGCFFVTPSQADRISIYVLFLLMFVFVMDICRPHE
jgi:hypothetical protein